MGDIGSELPIPARHGQNERMRALGRKAWLFTGSERGGKRAAVIYPLIGTANLNDVAAQARLADVLCRISAPQYRSALSNDELAKI